MHQYLNMFNSTPISRRPVFWLQAPVLQAGACCIWSLQTAIDKLDHSEIILNEEDSQYVCEYFQAFLLHWQGLFQTYSDMGVCRWKLRPKHHYFEEMMLQVQRTRINPRHLSCWQDESFLGHIKKIAIHCHSSSVLLRIFQRLMINLSNRFEKTRKLTQEVELLGCPKQAPSWKFDQLPL